VRFFCEQKIQLDHKIRPTLAIACYLKHPLLIIARADSLRNFDRHLSIHFLSYMRAQANRPFYNRKKKKKRFEILNKMTDIDMHHGWWRDMNGYPWDLIPKKNPDYLIFLHLFIAVQFTVSFILASLIGKIFLKKR
jgi:hypothetical protein